jgi:hypothetical protein
MKNLFVFIGLFISLGVFANKPYTDSICIEDITGDDTVLYISLGRVGFGGGYGLEVEYTDVDNDSTQFDLGVSMWGNTFNSYGTINAIDLPMYLDPADSTTINGVANNIDERSGYVITQAFYIDNQNFNYLCIKITKNTTTAGCIRFIIRQK